MASIKVGEIPIIQKIGKFTDDEKKIAQEIYRLVNSAGKKAEQFLKQRGPATNLDDLFIIKDSLQLREYEDIDFPDDMNDTPEQVIEQKPKIEKKPNMSQAPKKNQPSQTGNGDELPIDMKAFGDDIDEVPQASYEPITTEQAKERIYNSPEEVKRQLDQQAKPGQPVASTVIDEDPFAFQQPGGADAYDPDELPPGVQAPETPASDSGIELPPGAGKTAGPLPSNAGTDFSKMPNRNDIPGNQSSLGSKEQPFNPALNDAEAKEKKEAAAQLVDTILDGYKSAHRLFQYLVEVPEDRLVEMDLEGKIDLAMTIPVDENHSVTLIEYIKDFNQQAKEQLEYDPSFAKKVREPMIRVFMKHGWGLTDEQYLMLKWGEELAGKGMMIFGLRKSVNRTLEMLSKMYMKDKMASQPVREPAKEKKEEKPSDEVPGAEKGNFAAGNVYDADFEMVRE